MQTFTFRFLSATLLAANTPEGFQYFRKVLNAPVGVIVNLVPVNPALSFNTLRRSLSSRLGVSPSLFVDATSLLLPRGRRAAVCPGYPTMVIDDQTQNGVIYAFLVVVVVVVVHILLHSNHRCNQCRHLQLLPMTCR